MSAIRERSRHERVAMPEAIYRSDGPKTYYHYQSLKPPKWGWDIYTYFFLGGVAAGSYLVATLTALFGTGKDHSVGRAGRYVALASVMLWAKNYLLQGPLFLTSALSTGAAAVTLAMQGMKDVSPGTREWLEKTESRATLGELGLLLGSLVALRGRARPLLRQPFLVPFWLGYVGLGLIFPIVLRSQRGRAKPAGRAQRTVIASIAILVGGFIFRAVMVLAGQAETKDPEEYFAFTAAERTGG
ncbi:MAG: polysulfide reductase NrfD [Dehalococcoidales bacterium]|nr:polysulfide reductase NrfD [Dehalococcoidales bacterium]